MRKKKQKLAELRQFVVPMRWEYRGHAVVEAVDEEEAVAKCEKLDCEIQQDATAELINWEVTGDARSDD